jgi:hypothetical protein
MLAIAETHARFKAQCFYRPSRDGRVFLHHFPALRTGLLSPGPFGTDLLQLPNDRGNPDCDLLS